MRCPLSGRDWLRLSLIVPPPCSPPPAVTGRGGSAFDRFGWTGAVPPPIAPRYLCISGFYSGTLLLAQRFDLPFTCTTCPVTESGPEWHSLHRAGGTAGPDGWRPHKAAGAVGRTALAVDTRAALHWEWELRRRRARACETPAGRPAGMGTPRQARDANPALSAKVLSGGDRWTTGCATGDGANCRPHCCLRRRLPTRER